MRLVVGLLTAFLVLGMARAEPAQSLLKLESGVSEGALKEGALWFTLDFNDLRFVADPAKMTGVDVFFQALKESNKQGRSVSVWYDPDTATIDRSTMKPTFVVRSIVFNDKTYAGDEQSPARVLATSATALEKAEFALARGVAYAASGQSQGALPLLDSALANRDLAPQLRMMGLKARSATREDMALSEFPVGEARDKGLVGALEDARAWSAAAPDDADASFQTALDLFLLGGYDDALAIYNDILKRWPDRSYLALRRIAALYRDKGEAAVALTWIGKLGEVPGIKETMPYRYHRGWVLDELGRSEEAVAEYTEGLKYQPDYGGAFWRRACAQATLGHIKEALADFRTAAKLQEAFWVGVANSPGISFDRRRYAEVTDILERAQAEHPDKKIPDLCKGYWNWGDEPRDRSPLLPPIRK